MKTLLKVLYYLLGFASLGAFGAGPALAHYDLVPPQTGFLIFTSGCLLGALSTIIGLGIIVRRGPRSLLVVTLMGLGPAVYLVYSLNAGKDFPLINDITTERNYPPEFVYAKTIEANVGRDMTFPKDYKSQIEKAYPDLQTVGFQTSAEIVFGKALDLARLMEGWTVTAPSVNDKVSALEGYAVTPLFHFVDDFVIRVSTVEGGACVVDMRSKSRDGQGDFGANAKRIRAFLDRLQKSVNIRPAGSGSDVPRGADRT